MEANHCMVFEDSHLSVQQISKSIDVSSALANTVLTEILGDMQAVFKTGPKNTDGRAQAEND